MTVETPGSGSIPKRRRRRKAAGGRVAATGMGAGALLGIVGAIGVQSAVPKAPSRLASAQVASPAREQRSP